MSENTEKTEDSLNLFKEKDVLQNLIMESTENGYILFDKSEKIIFLERVIKRW